LSSSAQHNRYISTNFSAFSASKHFLILNHTKSFVEKIHSIDAELAGQAHKLDVKLQSLCGNGFSPCAVCVFAKPHHIGMNWPTTLWKQRWVHFFIIIFECHNRYDKLLCDSENGDIAWCNKNNSEWGFSVFHRKKNETLFLFEKPPKKRFFLNSQKNRWVGLFQKRKRVFLNPAATPPWSNFPLFLTSETKCNYW